MKRLALSITALLIAVGAALGSPVIRHAKISSKPASADPTQIGGPDWNADHVIDPIALLDVQGITVISSDPNGTAGALGALAWDRTNAQLWINTSGGTTWTPFVRADGGTSPAPLAFSMETDSNGMGLGADPTLADPTISAGTPNPNVQLVCMYSNNFSEPVSPTNMGSGLLREQGASTPGFGPELSIGKTLDELLNGTGATPDAQHRAWLDKFALASTRLTDWMQGSTSGNLSPLLGGGNLDADLNARLTSIRAVSGRELAGAFVMLTTNDTADGTAAAAVLTNAPAFVARRRALFGDQLAVVWVVPQTTVPEPNTSTVIANLVAGLTGIPGVSLVRADDLPANDDLVHFTANAEWTLGQRMGFAMARLRGLRDRIVTAPTVVGYSVASFNGSVHGEQGISGIVGTDLRVFPWQGSSDGDAMFIPVFSGSIGAGSSIPTPAGWTLLGTQISSLDAAGVGNHVALFAKPLQQSELDGNSGFPLSPTVTPGGAQFVGKPWTVRDSVRFPTLNAGPVAFTHTTFDTTPVTAPGVTTTATNRTIFILVTGWSAIGQSFTVANSNLSGLAQVYGAAYPSNSGNYLFIGLWTGRLAAAGASGNSIVTPVLANSSQGYTWAM